MKVFMLSLVMLIGVSFVGNAESNKIQINEYQDCLRGCQNIYDVQMASLPLEHGYFEALEIAADNLRSCALDC